MEAYDEKLGLLQRFQDGYTERDLSKLEEVMSLFATGGKAEMIGIGASERFQGREEIREIIESDWKYWGNVIFEVDKARIQLHGEVAWLTTRGVLIQTDTHDSAMPYYLE